jgi:hypothetical protein
MKAILLLCFLLSVVSYRPWYSFDGCDVLLPDNRLPTSIVHFVGGFIAGSQAPIAYNKIINGLADAGHAVVCTPIPAVATNHGEIAGNIINLFSNCYNNKLTEIIGVNSIRNVPVIGLSHSLGGKLMALLCSRKEDRKRLPYRYGNIYLCFNNYGIKENMELMSSQASALSPEIGKIVDTVVKTIEFQSIADALQGNGFNAQPFIKDLVKNDLLKSVTDRVSNIVSQSTAATTEFNKINFTPSPTETLQIIRDGYNIQKNVLIKFKDDNIDQSDDLARVLYHRACDIKTITLPGNHITPNTITQSEDNQQELFQQELVSLVNSMSMKAWDDINEVESRRFYLPPAVSSIDFDNDNV